MRAVVYSWLLDALASNVANATSDRPTDAVVKTTTTNICGPNLHMRDGRTSSGSGRTIGPENLGQPVEIGADVDLKRSDRVCLPFMLKPAA